MNANPPPSKLQSLPFRPRNLDSNIYYIDHQEVKGILSLTNIVTNVGRIPDNLVPQNQFKPENAPTAIANKTVISFTNQGDKHTPTSTEKIRQTTTKKDITSYVVNERNHEPWNEYVLGTQPPLLLKSRAILTKVEWVEGCYSEWGDPLLAVHHGTIVDVSSTSTPEVGMK